MEKKLQARRRRTTALVWVGSDWSATWLCSQSTRCPVVKSRVSRSPTSPWLSTTILLVYSKTNIKQILKLIIKKFQAELPDSGRAD